MSQKWRPAPLPAPALPGWISMVKTSWRGDLVAGITLWGLVVPEVIAYAGLAGLPPTSGVWALIIILPVYAIWGRSRHLVASPSSAIAATTGGLIAAMSVSDPVRAAAAVTITVGLVYLIAYVLRLGTLVHFISDPINAGFMFGLAVFIVVSQANKLLGIEGTSGTAVDRIVHLAAHLGETNWVTVALSVAGFALMLGIPRLSPRLPAGLTMIVLLSVLVAGLQLKDRFEVDTPGPIPTGLPALEMPEFSLGDVPLLVFGAVGIVLLAFSEATAVARSIAERSGYDYDADKDLFAFGIGNVLSGMVGGLAGAGSMTSSSTNETAGARTQLSTVVTAAAAMITVLFFGAAVANLPEAALAVLIIMAVRNHLSLSFVPRIMRFSRPEALISLLAAAGVLVLGVLDGLLVAMAVSLVWLVVRTMTADYVTIGQHRTRPDLLVSPESAYFQPLPPGMAGIRFTGLIFYANVERALQVIEDQVSGPHGSLVEPVNRVVVIDLVDVGFVDYTTAKNALGLTKRLDNRGVTVVFVGIKPVIIERLEEFGRIPGNVILLPDTDLAPVIAELDDLDADPPRRPDPDQS
ncbi:MAG: SulP family inorganic anion transporter [Actinomycetales bacterium]